MGKVKEMRVVVMMTYQQNGLEMFQETDESREEPGAPRCYNYVVKTWDGLIVDYGTQCPVNAIKDEDGRNLERGFSDEGCDEHAPFVLEKRWALDSRDARIWEGTMDEIVHDTFGNCPLAEEWSRGVFDSLPRRVRDSYVNRVDRRFRLSGANGVLVEEQGSRPDDWRDACSNGSASDERKGGGKGESLSFDLEIL